MGVRVRVGVAESRATNVLLRSVITARAVFVLLSLSVHEDDKVEAAVASNGGANVLVAVPDCVAVWLAIMVSVCGVTDERVKVQDGGTVKAAVGVRNRLASGWPKNRDPSANSASTRENASHCRPAVMRDWRVR
jgi:hypothetical protein